MRVNRQFFIRLSGAIVLIAALLYLSVLLILPNILDINKYKTMIEEQVKESSGFIFNAEHLKLKTSFSPYLNLYAYHVLLKYPDGQTFVKITDANIKIRVFPLLLKKVKIEKIILNRPILNITLYGDCTTSIERHIKKHPYKAASSSFFKLDQTIPSVYMNRYKLKINDVNFYFPFIAEGDRLVISDLILDKSFHIAAKGNLSQNKNKYLSYDLDIFSEFFNTKDNKFFKVSPFFNIRKYNLKSDIYAHLKIKSQNDFPNINGDLSFSNLGFKIDDRFLSGNKFRLKFTGTEAQVDADIKTSDKDNAKIQGKIAFGKNPLIDLKVKALNAGLANLQDLAIAVLDTLNIKNPVKDYEISGSANFDFYIKSNFKKIESKGLAKIENASIGSKISPLKITSLNSDVTFENNEIKIKKAKCLLNSNPIEIKGNVDSNAYADIIISAISLPLNNIFADVTAVYNKNLDNIKVKSGNLTFNAYLKGKLDKLHIVSDAKIKDLSICDEKNMIDYKSPEISANIGYQDNKPLIKLLLNNVNINSKTYNLTLFSKKLAVNTLDKDIIIVPSDISVNGAAALLKGSINNYLKNPEVLISAKGKINSKDIYNLIDFNNKPKASAKGFLPFIMDIKSDLKNTDIKLQIKADSTNYLSFAVIKELLNLPGILNISLYIKDNIINVSDFSLYKMKVNSSLTQNYNSNLMGGVKVLSLNGKIKDIQNNIVENFRIFIPESVTFSLAGLDNSEISLKSDITLSGKLETPKIKGSLTVNSAKIPQWKLNSGKAVFALDSSNVSVNIPSISIGKSNFNISANLIPDFKKKLVLNNVKLQSSNFDLDDLVSSFSPVLNNQFFPGISVPLSIVSGKAFLAEFSSEQLRAKNVNADIELNNNLLKIKNVVADAYNGRIWGNVNYDFLSAMTTANISGKSIDSDSAFTALTGIKDDMTGKLSFNTNFTMYGYTKQQQLRSLKGKTSIRMENGQVGTLGKFEHFLYAQNLISQSLMKSTINLVAQAVAPKNTGRFKYLKAYISFSDGYADVKQLEFSGPNMSMLTSGKLNLLNNWVDFVILGKVSHEVMNVLGPLGELSLSNIIDNFSQNPSIKIPNLFYNSYNLEVSQEILNKIPPLTPKTNLKTKDFTVKIHGNMDSVKSVKSFKWLVPPNQSKTFKQIKQEVVPAVSTPLNTEIKQLQPMQNIQPSVSAPPPQIRNNEPLPSFLDNLPDDIK